MTAPSRTRLATDERRTQLLLLGRRLFHERAYDDLSVDEIAAAAGISKGLLYHYFPSKRRFYVETVRAAAQEMVDRTAPLQGLPAGEKLQRGLDAYLDYVEQNAAAYGKLLRSGIGADPEVAAIVEETRQALMRRILAQELGVARPRPALRLALRGWIGFVEAASLDWIDHRDVDRDAMRATLGNA